MIQRRIPGLSAGPRVLASAVFLLLYLPISCAGNKDSSPISTDTTYLNLRGAYYGTIENQKPVLIGKVGVVLVEPSGFKQVPLDYSFKSGNKFRFLVSSNHDGFLYILLKSSDNNLKLLWPHEKVSDTFKIDSVQTYTVPPSPGVFIFDEEVGKEHFFIAVRSEPKAPKLGVLDSVDKAAQSVATPEIGQKPSTDKVEWVIRGDPFGEGSKRGVIFDPGTADSDLFRYFAAAPGDFSTKAMVQIMLRHSE